MSHPGCNTTDIDDAAAVGHVRHGSLDEKISGSRIDVEGFVPQREIEVRDICGHDYRAGAVDYDINGRGVESL